MANQTAFGSSGSHELREGSRFRGGWWLGVSPSRCLIPLDSHWFRPGGVTQFWLMRPIHKTTATLLRTKVFSPNNDVECRRRHDPLLCLWLFVAEQSCDHKELTPSALSPGLPLSFISVVSSLPNSDPTPSSFSLARDPVLEESLGWSVPRAHGVQTAPDLWILLWVPCPQPWMDSVHHTFQWVFPVVLGLAHNRVHHLMTFLCFLTQSHRHHADLAA